PGMDGIEVCRRLKADAALADIPIIFVTARSEPDEETRALEAGGVDFIAKPVNPAVVRARVRTHLTLKAQSDLLRSLVFVDGLTGVANRRRFDEALHDEWQHCRRAGAALTLHLVGDACLKRIAAVLQAGLRRAGDVVARYGGEEFACLLPECDLPAGRAKADELCATVAALEIPHADSPTAQRVTLSVGVATMRPNGANDPTALVAAADAALYEAKRAGRNRVVARA
ncbi:MAG: diguanylate cyclase, partial [Proteobacteria bacterium]|nr:diguanylate cyclase [Pseudomonadota bacterium]